MASSKKEIVCPTHYGLCDGDTREAHRKARRKESRTDLLEDTFLWETRATPEKYNAVVQKIEKDIKRATGLVTLASL